MDRIEILRKAIKIGEASYSKALDRGDYDDANFYSRTIDGLQELLMIEIMASDPYTTEADVRYFENNG